MKHLKSKKKTVGSARLSVVKEKLPPKKRVFVNRWVELSSVEELRKGDFFRVVDDKVLASHQQQFFAAVTDPYQEPGKTEIVMEVASTITVQSQTTQKMLIKK